MGGGATILTREAESWNGSHLISVTQVTPCGLALLHEVATSMRDLVRNAGGDDRLKYKVLATVFYEASTRTSCSFQAAMKRLGGEVIHVDAGKSGNSSAGKKGETLTDTINCLECYADVTVLRHPIVGSVKEAASKAVKPVINAGDGIGEHPTQALLDLFTIWDELGVERCKNDTITIVLLGDLKHGRTVHSLAKLLARSGMKKVVLKLCSPPSLTMPDYVKEYLQKYDNIVTVENFDLKEAIGGSDVLYVTRVQKERFESEDAYNSVKVSLLSLLNRDGIFEFTFLLVHFSS